MSHFGYTRPAGVWAPLTVGRASELASLDAKTYKAINGDEGGTWAPTDPIIIGGGGVEVDAPFIVSVSGGAMLVVDSSKARAYSPNGTHGFNIVDGGAQALGTWQWATGAGATFGSGSTLTVASGATASVAGSLSTTGTVSLGGTTTIGGTTTLNGTTTISGAGAALKTALTLSDAGRIAYRAVVGADADTTYSVADVDEVIITGITAARAYSVDTAGAVNGSRIRFAVQQDVTTNTVTVTAGTNSAPMCWTGGPPAGIVACEFVYVSGAWRVSNFVWHP